ncbi:hypothetical protein HNQ68_003068 [Pseudochrobactrum saccharolyticum]|uniref:Uncharacterized protein n=1 Tax=Pseudochrobactrum saccharolyticum TaxID=354352 RepID=A0A7W8ALG4_9HYPH|nr:hypothetical protein [Pseudochrobactrum saccharolyticum]
MLPALLNLYWLTAGRQKKWGLPDRVGYIAKYGTDLRGGFHV